MKFVYKESSGSYIDVGEVKVPSLVSTDTTYEIRIWEQRHKEYLKE